MKPINGAYASTAASRRVCISLRTRGSMNGRVVLGFTMFRKTVRDGAWEKKGSEA
jgi:hypothetical protein